MDNEISIPEREEKSDINVNSSSDSSSCLTKKRKNKEAMEGNIDILFFFCFVLID